MAVMAEPDGGTAVSARRRSTFVRDTYDVLARTGDWLDMATIAGTTGYCRIHVRKALRDLITSGKVEQSDLVKRGRTRLHLYRLVPGAGPRPVALGVKLPNVYSPVTGHGAIEQSCPTCGARIGRPCWDMRSERLYPVPGKPRYDKPSLRPHAARRIWRGDPTKASTDV